MRCMEASGSIGVHAHQPIDLLRLCPRRVEASVDDGVELNVDPRDLLYASLDEFCNPRGDAAVVQLAWDAAHAPCRYRSK